jgi:phospholipase/carboxylesterase
VNHLRRREFLGAISVLAATGCSAQSPDPMRLRARPFEADQKGKPLTRGAVDLGLRPDRDATLYVPKSLAFDKPAPLVVFVHGAGGPYEFETTRMRGAADEHGFLLLAPLSKDRTWDGIRGNFDVDVRFIDSALARSFAMCRIDPRRIALAGFSDGASYALGLGPSNADFFSAVAAFSPGFIPPGSKPNGHPRMFISHGTADQILPIDQCSRRLVPELKAAGFNVTYREFDGPHTMPVPILGEAMKWFLAA